MSEHPQVSGLRSQVSSDLLSRFRSDRKRLPIHPLERAVLVAVVLHLCFLPWALGTMQNWSRLTSLVLAAAGLALALIPRNYTSDQSGGAAFRLNPWPRLFKFPIFWIGLALLGYIGLQEANPSWEWERNATHWWLRRVTDIPWLPTSIDVPAPRFNLWQQLIFYAAAWVTICTVWVGFTRRRSLQILLLSLIVNAVILAGVGFFQKFAVLDSFLYIYRWPRGHTAFASFIYRNHAGAYFALLTFATVAYSLWTFTEGEKAIRKSTPASLLFFCAVFLSVAVVFTLSRGASLLLAMAWLALGLWFWLSRRNSQSGVGTHRGVYAALAALFVAVIGFTAVEVDFSAALDRFDSLAKNYQRADESVQSRIQAHAAADTMLGDHWLRGVGAGGFRYLFPEYIKKYPEVYNGGRDFWEHAHSDWRQIPIELGLTGTLLLVLGAAYWMRIFYRGHALWHELAAPIAIACSQTLAHAWFDFPFQCPAILITWLALIAISARWLELDGS